MEKQKKFAILKGIGLTKAEAEEYFAVACLDVPLAENKIKTLLDVAYVKEGAFERLPYLDLDRIGEVWGICIGKVAYRNVHEPDCTQVEAMGTALNLAKVYGLPSGSIFLPSITQLEHVTCNSLLYEVTSDILRAHGVFVEPWLAGAYWTSLQYNTKYAYIYDVKTGKNTADRVHDAAHHVRLAFSFE